MVPEYMAYLSAQRSQETFVRYALSDSSLETTGVVPPPADRFGRLRAGISADLRRLADRLDPGPHPRRYAVETA